MAVVNRSLGFYINLPLGAIAIIFLLVIQVPDLTVKEDFSLSLLRKVMPELDLIGFALFAPAAIMLMLALQFGSDNRYAWNSQVIIGLFCGAGVFAIIFTAWEIRVGDRAMIPPSVVRQRIVWASAGQIICMASSMFVGSSYLPLYFQAVKGVGPTISGVNLLPSILSQLLFVVLSGAAGTCIWQPSSDYTC